MIELLKRNHNALAWLLLMVAIALHVLDEALTGFLPFYNNLVATLREEWGFFPMPVFSFDVWIGGLTIGIIAGLAMTPLVAAGGRAIRAFTVIFGILMIGNGLGHLAGSLYTGYLLPGVTSAPLILVTAIFVLRRGLMADWSPLKRP